MSVVQKVSVLLMGVLLFVTGCEKDDLTEDEKENNGTKIESTSRPDLYEGSSSSTASEFQTINHNFQNPFKGVDLHDPNAIALVSTKDNSVKKSYKEDPVETTYNLYEVISDSFKIIKGQEGNEIFLSGIFSLNRINQSWQLFGGEDMDITISTNEMVVDYIYEIKTDSIFLSDTIPENLSGKDPYEDIGDSLFVSSDTTVYNDTLWIQLKYVYTDTTDVTVDTAYTIKSKNYKALLLNTNNGDLFDVGEYVSLVSMGNKYSEPVKYVEAGNSFYFRNFTGNEVCKINLSDLTLETYSLPYEIDGIWSEVDGNIFFTNMSEYPNAFCYKPNQGLITKSNIWPNPDMGSCWIGKNNTYFWIRGVQGAIITPQGLLTNPGVYSMFTLEIRNDSMIFSPVEIITDIDPVVVTDVPELDVFVSSIGDYISYQIYEGKDRWFFYDTDGTAWKYNKETSEITILGFSEEILRNRISDGLSNHYSLFNNSVYKLDLGIPSLDEFITISELDIASFSIGPNSNIFVSGMRFSDLSNAKIEYDGKTGEKLGEWIEEGAPMESNIVKLSPVFGD